MKNHSQESNGLKIIIVGTGKVGASLIESLSKEGNDITIIDSDPAELERYTGQYDVLGVLGNGASYSVLTEAGVEQCDLLIAVTGSDELNLLCCIIAKRFSNCETIARVRAPEYAREIGYIREKLGISLIINPDLEAAKEAARIIALPQTLEATRFAHNQADLINVKIPAGSILDGKKIMDLGREATRDMVFCVMEREDRLCIPTGQTELRAGDVISFVATRSRTTSFLNEIGLASSQMKNVMIIGCSRCAYYLATLLDSMNISVKIIDVNREACEKFAELLPNAIIINGDATSEELLKEEGISRADAFIPLTGFDEENILLTLHARKVSNAKTITKINRIAFRDALNDLDLGSVLYPKYLTSDAIVAYARGMKNTIGNSKIHTLNLLFNKRVEALEFRVKESSAVIGVPLCELKTKPDLIVAFIQRNGKNIFPSGQDCIEIDDTVMVVTTQPGLTGIDDILE